MKLTILDDRRVLVGGAALVALLLVVATWFLAVGPKLAEADDLGTQRDDALTQNATLVAKNAELAEQQEQFGQLEADLEAAQAGLPASTAFPEFTRQVAAGADAAGVSLGNVSISAPQPVAGAAAPAAAAGGQQTAPAQQSIAVSLTSSGTLRQQTAFLKGLQGGARRALVTSSQVAVDGGSRTPSVDGKTLMTTQITLFTAP